MREHLNAVLEFFYTEKTAVSAYNNRFAFGIADEAFYQIIEFLEERKLIEAVGIRQSRPGYNLYQITLEGIQFMEAGGF